MFSWLRRMFGRIAGVSAPDARSVELVERILAYESAAWWKDLPNPVGPNDVPTVVVAPHRNATPDQLRSLGEGLRRWQQEYSPARPVWGLDDLLAGRRPRTPPIYLAVPVPADPSYAEPIALIFAPHGTDEVSEVASVQAALPASAWESAWVADVGTYELMQR